MYEAYIEGIFPRNDDLIYAWKKFDAGVMPRSEFYRLKDISIKKVVDIQLEARLPFIHDPYIDWHDLFRPFTEIDGIDVGPITRYYENNVFYKKPMFKKTPSYPKGLLSKYLHTKYLPSDHLLTSTLPGPYTFYKLSEFENNVDPVQSISNILRGALNDIIQYGYSFVSLAEPEIAYSKDLDLGVLRELYNKIKNYERFIRIHLFFGDVSQKIDLIESLPVSGYSIDLQYTNPLNLECPRKHITLGVIDGSNTLMEDTETVINIVKLFTETCSIRSLALSNNMDLDFLPYHVAIEKVYTLGKIYRRLVK